MCIPNFKASSLRETTVIGRERGEIEFDSWGPWVQSSRRLSMRTSLGQRLRLEPNCRGVHCHLNSKCQKHEPFEITQNGRQVWCSRAGLTHIRKHSPRFAAPLFLLAKWKFSLFAWLGLSNLQQFTTNLHWACWNFRAVVWKIWKWNGKLFNERV